MKIEINREDFLSVFQTAAAIAPSRSPKPILQNVKLIAEKNSVTILATDLEIGVRVKVGEVKIEKSALSGGSGGAGVVVLQAPEAPGWWSRGSGGPQRRPGGSGGPGWFKMVQK